MTEADKQITRWSDPGERMEARWLECPWCRTIGTIKHEPECSKPGMEKKRSLTTQFGPCSYGVWVGKLRDQLNGKGGNVLVKTNDAGLVALFDA